MQRLAMVDEIIRVAHAVALKVRAVGILRVGPPIVALGEKIMEAARAARRMRRGYRDRLVVQIRIGGFDHADSIECADVELLAEKGQRRGQAKYNLHTRRLESRITNRDGIKMRFISDGFFASMHSHNKSAAASPMVALL
jgi:hypothetical protein